MLLLSQHDIMKSSNAQALGMKYILTAWETDVRVVNFLLVCMLACLLVLCWHSLSSYVTFLLLAVPICYQPQVIQSFRGISVFLVPACHERKIKKKKRLKTLKHERSELL